LFLKSLEEINQLKTCLLATGKLDSEVAAEIAKYSSSIKIFSIDKIPETDVFSD
jgi:hypothetical protein